MHRKNVTKDIVRLEQRNDEFCNSLQIEEANRRIEYFYDQGVIYKRSKGEHSLLLPLSLVKGAIALNHNPTYGAHPGQ
jgi:hypothetical protein